MYVLGMCYVCIMNVLCLMYVLCMCYVCIMNVLGMSDVCIRYVD